MPDVAPGNYNELTLEVFLTNKRVPAVIFDHRSDVRPLVFFYVLCNFLFHGSGLAKLSEHKFSICFSKSGNVIENISPQIVIVSLLHDQPLIIQGHTARTK